MPKGVVSQVVRIKAPAKPVISDSLRVADQYGDRLEEDAMLKGLRFDGGPFAGTDAEVFEAMGCRFENARFTGSRLERGQFSDSAFVTCDFSQVSAHDVSLIRCSVTGSRITGSSWKSGTFRDVHFSGCVIAPAMFRQMKLFAVKFSDCKLSGADFQGAEFHNVQFESCDLTGAQFANTKIGATRFDLCTLADVGGAASLKGAAVRGPGALELALSLAREAGIRFEEY